MSKFDKKVQKEVSQIANSKLSHATTIGGLSVNLNHLKMRAVQRKSTGTPSATVSMPPPLMAQPSTVPQQNLVQHRIEEEQGVGDILFKVAGNLPPMDQCYIQFVHEENGTTYMKM